MTRLSRMLAGVTVTMAVAGCTGVPNLGGPGETLSGKVSGSVTSLTKVAVLEGRADLDFTNARVLTLDQGRFTYSLPADKTTAVLAAFEDANGNNRWDEGEAITTSTRCASCSYLRLTHDGTSWKVIEQLSGVARTTTLTDSTIAFNA